MQNQEGKNLLVIDDIKTDEEFELIKDLQTNFELLITSRTEFDTQFIHKVEQLPYEEAKELFLKYYKTEKNIDDILEYLDYHTLFIELTAKTLAKSNILTIEKLEKKFENGEFETIKNNYEKKTFDTYLNELFKLDTLEESEILLLKQLSLFPSIEISFEYLKDFLVIEDKDIEKFDENLVTLCKTGWLIQNNKSFKLHQIIKEFLHIHHPNSENDCEKTIQYFNTIIYYHLKINPLNAIDYIPFATSIINSFSNQSSIRLSELMHNLALVFSTNGNYKNSLKYLLLSIDIIKGTFGEDSSEIATTYNNLAGNYRLMGNLNEAIKYQEKAIYIREKHSDESSDIALNYGNLAITYYDFGDLPTAFKYGTKCITILEKNSHTPTPNLATAYNDMSLILQKLNKLDESLCFQKKALNIRKIILDNKHPAIGQSYNNLSLIYNDLKIFKKALTYQKKALRLYENILNNKHPDLAISYNNISGIYRSLENLPQALKYLKKALNIQENIYSSHPSLATSYANIAQLYMINGQVTDASIAINKADNIFRKSLPVNHPDVQNTVVLKNDIDSMRISNVLNYK